MIRYQGGAKIIQGGGKCPSRPLLKETLQGKLWSGCLLQSVVIGRDHNLFVQTKGQGLPAVNSVAVHGVKTQEVEGIYKLCSTNRAPGL